tara:strand:- start:30 stop:251 length:222 start_codon:yes stop_codon:yes gene_type:complete
MNRKYKLIYKIDHLDDNPMSELFDSSYELFEFLQEEVQRRVDFAVSHSPYKLSNQDIKDLEETEYSLVRIEEL